MKALSILTGSGMMLVQIANDVRMRKYLIMLTAVCNDEVLFNAHKRPIVNRNARKIACRGLNECNALTLDPTHVSDAGAIPRQYPKLVETVA
jgi:hypothetical protein